MAKLEIKKREGAQGHMMMDYDILVDGQEPTLLTGLKLDIGIDQFNEATLTFMVDDLKVDGEFLTLLNAKIDEKDSVRIVNEASPAEYRLIRATDYESKKE